VCICVAVRAEKEQAMKETLMCLAAAMAVSTCAFAAGPVAEAAYKGNSIRLYANPLSYEVAKDGKVLVSRTPIGLCVDGTCVAKDARLSSAPRATFRSGSVASPVYKKSSVDLSGVETVADFGEFAVSLVARADGVAYRIELKKPGVVTCEKADLTVPKAARCWFNRTPRGSLGCEETVPEFADAAALPADEGKAFYLPFVYSVDGQIVAVMESDVHDYPVWNFGDVEKVEGGVRLTSLFAKYPRKTVHTANIGGWGNRTELPKGGRWVTVKESESFIVRADSPRTLPWRVFALADSPSKLCEADIVYALATPAEKGADFSWVKPGKVAWDWWNAFDNKGDPEGCTTETYKRFIDFAAANGVEYVIFDEGWSAKLNIWEYSPVVDVPYLIDYADKKGVGIILWMAWAQIVGEEEKVAAHFSKLGAKGFKVDFMDRADAEIAVFLDTFAAACAKHKMLVDYHGAYRPVGLHRTYPNVLNYEGIHGLEQMKWGKKDKDMPFNDVAAFFLRMTAGPMDYTPCAFSDSQHPHITTNPHELALTVLFESGLQHIADRPESLLAQPQEVKDFFSELPVAWDETKFVCGYPGEYVVLARRKGTTWYIAGINGTNEVKSINVNLDFIGQSSDIQAFFDDDENGWKIEHLEKLPQNIACMARGGFLIVIK